VSAGDRRAPLTITRATAADLDVIEAISRASFPRPWPRHLYVEELARPHACVEVARTTDDDGLTIVAGYVVSWSVVDEVHLLEIAVAPAMRGRGVGDALVHALCDRADRAGARLVTLEVRAGNAAARRLYDRHGFTVVATRRAYYDDGEDGVVMLRTRG
jgi:ribosomal-protein-alanine N-acetyltransferase